MNTSKSKKNIKSANNLAKGIQFEQRVLSLLREMSINVAHSVQVGYKKIDIYGEQKRLNKLSRIAIECKSDDSPLSQDYVSKIKSNYEPLFEANLIDELFIVTLNGISETSEQMVKMSRWVTHIDIETLQNSLMDFSNYISFIKNSYHDDGLFHYYVPFKEKDNILLEEKIIDWIVSDSKQPVVILGSYGIGKTTFTRHISYVLANNNDSDNYSRIPIIIKLGDITSEQSLEGLIGRTLTVTSSVKNYSFFSFMNFNKNGRFVIILDGFDEMKHTLTWDEFRYNMKELHRLVCDKSKIILLGRPTAFLNDDEHNFILHGNRTINNLVIKDKDWPDYIEMSIKPFDKIQVKDFLSKYFKYKGLSIYNSSIENSGRRNLADDIEKVSSKHLSDIARRPVQLRMIAEILPQWVGSIDDLTIPALYEYFIDLIIEREQEKDARSEFNADQRRHFSREVAFWLWKRRGRMGIGESEIPDEIFSSITKKKTITDGERRDLVSACILERKLGDFLYFPHRSFQEFLVAEKILDDLCIGRISIGESDQYITDEVATFINGLIGWDECNSLRSNLEKYNGPISWRVANLLVSNERFLDRIVHEVIMGTPNHWDIMLSTIAILSNRIKEVEIYEKRRNGKKGEKLLNKNGMLKNVGAEDIFCQLVGMSKLISTPGRVEDFLLYFCVILISYNSSFYQESIVSDVLRRTGVVDALIKNGRAIKTETTIKCHLSGGYVMLCSALQPYCLIREWIVGETIRPQDYKLPAKIDLEISTEKQKKRKEQGLGRTHRK